MNNPASAQEASLVSDTTQSNWKFFFTLLLLCSAPLFSCSPFRVDSSSRLNELERIRYPTIAITPPQLFMEHRPHQVFQYTYDLVEYLSQEAGLPVLAPWEYDTTGTAGIDGVPESALYRLCDHSAVSLTDIVLLDFRIEEASSSRSVGVPASMGGGVRHQAESRLSIIMTLRPFPHGPPLAEVRLEFEDDPYTYDQDPRNPRPILREGIRLAARRLHRLFESSYLEPYPGAPEPLSLLFNPIAMFTYEGGAGEPLERDFDGLDALDRLTGRLIHYQYFAPSISTGTVEFFEQHGAGLLVQEIPPGTTYPLEVGDFIVRANGHPIHGPQSLQREFMFTPVGGTVRVGVLRNDSSLDLDLPVRAR